MIIKPENMDFSNKKIAMIVAGVPGIGKTTLALSAPRPLLVDVDEGISRVDAHYRKDAILAKDYESLLEDLENEDLSDYETIVVDTGGKLFEIMKPYVIKQASKNGKSDGTLSLQGYGATKREYARFVNLVKKLDKNLVFVFHATEVKMSDQDEKPALRIRIEGGTKDEIFDEMDLVCFMEMKGKSRTIGFSNCERYYAKGTHGIHGVYDVPELNDGAENDYLSRLFAKVREDLNKGVSEEKAYKEAMKAKKAVDEATDATTLNEAYEGVKKAKHALTSKKELWIACQAKAKAFGLAYDKEKDEWRGI